MKASDLEKMLYEVQMEGATNLIKHLKNEISGRHLNTEDFIEILDLVEMMIKEGGHEQAQ